MSYPLRQAMVLWIAIAFAAASAQAGAWGDLSAVLERERAAWGLQAAPAEPPLVPRPVRAPFPRRSQQDPGLVPSGPPVVVELDSLLNANWRSPIVFQAGSLTVHVSGTKSSNLGHNWFLSLCADPCGTPVFFKGRDLLHYRPALSPVPIFNGSRIVAFDGRKYKLTVEGQLVHREESRIRVEPLDKSERRREWTARQIAGSVFNGGRALALNGRAFRLLYMQEILEDEDGQFAGFSNDRALVFMTSEPGRYVTYTVRLGDVGTDRVTGFALYPASAGEKTEKVAANNILRVGLRVDPQGRLEVYDGKR